MKIGTDIIEVKRIKKAIESPSFRKRIFTEKEWAYIEEKKKPETAAGLFAAKESVAKALGTGFSGFLPKDIEVFHINQAPQIKLHNKAKDIARKMNVSNIEISIAHETDYAIAFALLSVNKGSDDL